MLRVFFITTAWSPFSDKSNVFVNLLGAFALFAIIQVVYTAVAFNKIGIPFAGLLFFILNIKNLPNPFTSGTIAEALTKENLNETVENMTSYANNTITNLTANPTQTKWWNFRFVNPLK